MHIMMVADGRSPTTRGWIGGLTALQHEVTLISTYPCSPIAGVAEMYILPVALSAMAIGPAMSSPNKPAFGHASPTIPVGTSRVGLRKQVLGRSRRLAMNMRYLIGPLTLAYYAARLKRIIQARSPDLVHALRIPFEGMLAAAAEPSVPLIVSIWGNDLTLHASGSSSMRRLTHKTLRRANGLLADAHRDIRLGHEWGFAEERPWAVLPGGGGIDLLEMHRIRSQAGDDVLEEIPTDRPVAVNPRGFRPGSVRNDIFFESMPLVLERNPNVTFVCTGMAGQIEAVSQVQRRKLQKNLILLPFLPQARLWRLFQRSELMLSISSHDGTPNSLLESMVCGSFPIAGDIESVREWITPGVNGMLVEPGKAQSVAESILTALAHPELREQAAEKNMEIIRDRAEVELVRSQMEVFYRRILS